MHVITCQPCHEHKENAQIAKEDASRKFNFPCQSSCSWLMQLLQLFFMFCQRTIFVIVCTSTKGKWQLLIWFPVQLCSRPKASLTFHPGSLSPIIKASKEKKRKLQRIFTKQKIPIRTQKTAKKDRENIKIPFCKNFFLVLCLAGQRID